MSAAHSQQRRNIIRATWQSLYPNLPVTTRFVISNPGEQWMPLIRQENATYGDLILLPQLKESAQVANSVKSIEFLKYLTTCGSSWRYVSKLDDDSYLDVLSFYREFLYALLNREHTNRTVIGRRMKHWNPDFEYPGGQFYTLSWDLVLILVRLYSMKPITDEHEDVLVGALLHSAGESFEFIGLENSKAFDYDESNEDIMAWSHRLVKGAINPHKLKDDDTYLRVASMYDGNGVKDV